MPKPPHNPAISASHRLTTPPSHHPTTSRHPLYPGSPTQGVTLDVSKRVVEELGTWAKKENDESEGEEEDESVLDKLARTSNHVSKLTQVLRDVQLFKAPDGTCLSPAGEYNLRLGIMKG